jgi:hypothetical protein
VVSPVHDSSRSPLRDAKQTDVDIAFGDSHSLWTQHSSGAFSQLDLRHAWKPLDAVSSTALCWEVSGALAFVSDSPSSHSIPYDDV